jgi:AraC-like DNA-binding protein
METAVRPVAVKAWRPPVPGVREVLHASLGTHAYPPHVHDAWTLFVVDVGGVRYDLDRHHRAAPPGVVSILAPGVVHDGRPATADGYRKRVVYLDPGILGEDLVGPSVDRPVVPGRSLLPGVNALHRTLDCPDDGLEAETLLHELVTRIRAAYALPAPVGRDPSLRPRSDLAEAVRAALEADLTGRPSIAAIADGLGVGATTATRAFRAAFGIPPHAYVLGRRLEIARGRLLAGQPLADVAFETGFSDQAHLTNRFRRFQGVSPGRYRAAG